MKRILLKLVKKIYRSKWVQKLVEIFRLKSILFLAEEMKDGSLSYGFKATIYSGAIQEQLKVILAKIPSQLSHQCYSPLYSEMIIVESIENGDSLQKLVLDLHNIVQFLDIAKTEKKNKPEKVTSILFVTSMFPSVEHGGGLKIFDTIQELTNLGYKISLYSQFNESQDRMSYAALMPSLVHVRLVDPQHFDSYDFMNWLNRKNLSFDLAHYVWPQASKLIPQNHDRIRCHVFDFIETTARRCIMDIESMLEKNDYKLLGRRLLDLVESLDLEARACAFADKFICITEKDSEFSRDLYKIPEPHVVQIGVSRHAILDRLNDEHIVGIKEKPFSAGFIGNYNHYPNIDGIEWYLNNVHPLVLAKVPNYTFFVIGFGLPDSLKRKYVHPSINFVGPVDNVIEALKPLSVCVAPLISGAGFRVKLNQFSVLSKPTVSTTIGACGMPYVNGKSIFITDSPEEFADDVINLLLNGNLNEDVGKKAYDVVQQNYFWEPHIKKLVYAYEN